MAMGTTGMTEMAEMAMPLPENTLPMMTGEEQFGGIEMGGMFTVVKVREGLRPGDYKDPGPYQHPPGTVAYEVDVAEAGAPEREPGAGTFPQGEMPGMNTPETNKPGMHHHKQQN
jgi:L-ascorbate oxidase